MTTTDKATIILNDKQYIATVIIHDKRLKTIKSAAKETGSTETFLRALIRSGELSGFKIHRRTYISMIEFESITTQIKPTAVVE